MWVLLEEHHQIPVTPYLKGILAGILLDYTKRLTKQTLSRRHGCWPFVVLRGGWTRRKRPALNWRPLPCHTLTAWIEFDPYRWKAKHKPLRYPGPLLGSPIKYPQYGCRPTRFGPEIFLFCLYYGLATFTIYEVNHAFSCDKRQFFSHFTLGLHTFTIQSYLLWLKECFFVIVVVAPYIDFLCFIEAVLKIPSIHILGFSN